MGYYIAIPEETRQTASHYIALDTKPETTDAGRDRVKNILAVLGIAIALLSIVLQVFKII
ncbi:MAG: hypothetical protein KJ653_04300 [Candidatus Thermoplasmatota archaeon]|nr:hypothetical protein [Candidatus Thermoplasmatota archaeon]